MVFAGIFLSVLLLHEVSKAVSMSIKENLDNIKRILGKNTKLVAISKTKPVGMILECYHSGQRIFGENKVQELYDKYKQLPNDIEWHLVGHLQTNKIKFIVPFISLIHSVDSLKLLIEINKQALSAGRIVNCLFQIHIAREKTKYGLTEDEAFRILKSDEFKALKNISIRGVMGMATNTDIESEIRKEFRGLKMISEKLASEFSSPAHPCDEISMGMSNDFRLATEEGSTMVRIGSLIFGKR